MMLSLIKMSSFYLIKYKNIYKKKGNTDKQRTEGIQMSNGHTSFCL